MADSVFADKRALRTRMKLLRAAISAEEVASLSERIWERLRMLPLWRDARVIHTFIGALPGEVRTESLIRWCLERGRTVLVPVVDAKARTLRHVRLVRFEDVRRTSWGGLEPIADLPANPASADLIIVPGLAFDRQGHRLGMGGGFYDRFLASVSVPSIAVAFPFQIVESVPVDERDVRVSLIVTPDEVIVPDVPRPTGRGGGYPESSLR